MANPARRIFEPARPQQPRCYSYTRFSTPQQAQGDSLRRQVQLANEWAAREGLTIDTSLTLHDAGRSAFRGRNTEEGSALALFLSLVQEGTVPRGSVLLVESLDRVSRQTARRALRTLESIVDAGVDVVTLSDGKRYSKDGLDNDPTSLIMSLLIFVRANEESARKASRIRAVWEHKRTDAAAHGTPITGKVPAWLRREGNRFVLVPEHVATVKRIFTLVRRGIGLQRVAHMLNAEGIPPFGSPRKRGDGSTPVRKWHRSAVMKVVVNPAVMGTYVPHTLDYSSGRRVRQPGAPILRYFPRVIHDEVWKAVQSTRAVASHVPTDRTTQNLFGGGILRCALCGHGVVRRAKGPSGGRVKLRCSNPECSAPPVPYDEFEARAVEALPDLLADAPVTATGELEEKASRLTVQIEALDEAIARLLTVLEKGASAAVSMRLRVLEAERADLSKSLEEMNAEIVRLGDPRVARQVRHLSSADLTRDRAAANLRLRSIISSIKLDPVRSTAIVMWSGAVEGAASSFSFGFPATQRAQASAQERPTRTPTAKPKR